LNGLVQEIGIIKKEENGRKKERESGAGISLG
jgi:hypothetical protein